MVSSPRIEMALMDGSEPVTLFKSNLNHPQSLTIDKKENRLYWSDSSLNRIELSDLTGGNRRVLVDGQVNMFILSNFFFIQNTYYYLICTVV